MSFKHAILSVLKTDVPANIRQLVKYTEQECNPDCALYTQGSCKLCTRLLFDHLELAVLHLPLMHNHDPLPRSKIISQALCSLITKTQAYKKGKVTLTMNDQNAMSPSDYQHLNRPVTTPAPLTTCTLTHFDPNLHIDKSSIPPPAPCPAVHFDPNIHTDKLSIPQVTAECTKLHFSEHLHDWKTTRNTHTMPIPSTDIDHHSTLIFDAIESLMISSSMLKPTSLTDRSGSEFAKINESHKARMIDTIKSKLYGMSISTSATTARPCNRKHDFTYLDCPAQCCQQARNADVDSMPRSNGSVIPDDASSAPSFDRTRANESDLTLSSQELIPQASTSVRPPQQNSALAAMLYKPPREEIANAPRPRARIPQDRSPKKAPNVIHDFMLQQTVDPASLPHRNDYAVDLSRYDNTDNAPLPIPPLLLVNEPVPTFEPNQARQVTVNDTRPPTQLTPSVTPRSLPTVLPPRPSSIAESFMAPASRQGTSRLSGLKNVFRLKRD